MADWIGLLCVGLLFGILAVCAILFIWDLGELRVMLVGSVRGWLDRK